jgi:putative transposase
MPRKNLIRTADFPYHITSRSNNKEWFYVPIEDVWKYCIELLGSGSKKFNIKIYSFVLMANHYHLLLQTPDENIDKFMRFFNKGLSDRISRQASRINRIFGASYHWSLIKDDSYFINVYKYIYQNPLRAGLVSKCEKYRYTTLGQRLGLTILEESLLLSPTYDHCDYNLDELAWLNDSFCDTDLSIIKRGLKRTTYKETLPREVSLKLGKHYIINAAFSKKVLRTQRPSII